MASRRSRTDSVLTAQTRVDVRRPRAAQTTSNQPMAMLPSDRVSEFRATPFCPWSTASAPEKGMASKVDAVRERAALMAALLLMPYLTPEQTAIITQTSASTIRRACADGRLRAVRLAARQWRIEPSAIRQWLMAPEESRQPHGVAMERVPMT
jgi:excisionase family DNA binding protein